MKSLYENRDLLVSASVRFTFPDKRFVVDAQYFREVGSTNERHVSRGWFAFAVSTDGFDMLVDLAESELPILFRTNLGT